MSTPKRDERHVDDCIRRVERLLRARRINEEIARLKRQEQWPALLRRQAE